MGLDAPSSLRSVADALERGRWNGVVTRAIAGMWSPLATRALVRPGRVPKGIDVVCVGGATLGGSGKTRVAIACARELCDRGARVVVIGHAFKGAARRARLVRPDDVLAAVGDEALVCARALSDRTRASVVVAPQRQAAIDLAAQLGADVVVVDGPLRLREVEGSTLSLLAVDRARPWGSGELPPAGDLRAPKDALLALSDEVVEVDAAPATVRWADGLLAPATSLAGLKVGLFTAIARPERLARAVQTLGIDVVEIVSVPDHGPLGPDAKVRLSSTSTRLPWLATEKCAMHLAGIDLPAGLGVLPCELALPERALRRLRS